MTTVLNLKNTKPHMHMADVALIWMPFSDLMAPAIGLSLLKNTVMPIRVTTELLYLNLLFAKRIGIASYDSIFTMPQYFLAGDWVFSCGLVDNCPEATDYIDRVLKKREGPYGDPVVPPSGKLIRMLLKARLDVPDFLEECAEIVVNLRPRVVGFSVIFQQRTASLSLARLLKSLIPDAVIVFGGAGCEGGMGMELIASFPFVDAVVLGEGETVFPEIVKRVLGSEPLLGINGVLTRDNGQSNDSLISTPIRGLMTKDMDTLPYPIYDDYYDQLEKRGIVYARESRKFLFETSRGCWWGERNKCTFCGLTTDQLAFRSKSSQRVHDELMWMFKKYRPEFINMVDPVLNKSYLDDLIPNLTAEGPRAAIFWATRINLEKPQLRALRDAGIVWVQPGIESLSSRILKMVRKGTKAIQNMQFLKWCKEIGINVYWNLMYGFPGESPGEYDRMAEFIPLLVHLPPPSEMWIMHLERFSPYFEEPEAYGITDITPLPAYELIYPNVGSQALANLAYYFTFRHPSQKDVERYIKPLRDKVDEWMSFYGSRDLFFIDDGNALTVWDQRNDATPQVTMLRGIERQLYLACDSATRLPRLFKLLGEQNSEGALNGQVQEVLQSLVDRSLMIREGNLFLSLAIPVGDYHPAPETWERFQTFLKKREEAAGLEKLTANINLKEIPEGIIVSREELKGALRKKN